MHKVVKISTVVLLNGLYLGSLMGVSEIAIQSIYTDPVMIVYNRNIALVVSGIMVAVTNVSYIGYLYKRWYLSNNSSLNTQLLSV
jgi:hypothetical protein